MSASGNSTSLTSSPQEIAARRLSKKKLADGYQFTAVYTYRTLEGRPVYFRIRLDRLETGEKWIRPMYHDGAHYRLGEPPVSAAGKWVYGLDRLAANPNVEVFIVEGEECADRLNELGVLAITSGSCTSAPGANLTWLGGRSVTYGPIMMILAPTVLRPSVRAWRPSTALLD